MELIMEAQEDATPWPIVQTTADNDRSLLGRGSFSELGIVRRKPARGDSHPTRSKSCSDKLALKQCTSLLSSVSSLLINPANVYIDTLVLPQVRYRRESCRRAFGTDGRCRRLVGQAWPGGHRFTPFEIRTTTVEFEFSRTASMQDVSQSVGSNICAVWTPSWQQTLINGVIAGRKQFDPKGASRISRRRAWQASVQVMETLEDDAHAKVIALGSYSGLKDSKTMSDRALVKAEARALALPGWLINDGDDFEL